MGRASVLSLAFVMLMTGCSRSLPDRVTPPTTDQPEIGVAYGVVVYCAISIQIGSSWWSFDEPIDRWPADISIPPFPFSIWADVGEPYAVPGIVTLTTPTTAIFRADVDGSEFPLTGHDRNPSPGDACL